MACLIILITIAFLTPFRKFCAIAMTVTTRLQEPSQLNEITLRLEHLKERERPEELMLALHCYTRGYRKLSELVGGQIEPDVLPVFRFEHVQRGSVELKNKVGYGTGVVNFLSNAIVKLLSTDSTDDNIEDKAELLERETSDYIESKHCYDRDLAGRREPYIDRIVLAEVLNDFSDAGQLLMNQEYFEIINDEYEDDENKVVKFKTDFRSSISISELKKSKPTPFNGRDTVIALKPCNVGESSWYLESTVTKRKYYAVIRDTEWLRKYQSGQFPSVYANDLINVNLKCDIVVSKAGTTRNANAEITRVYNVERGRHIPNQNQVDLF
ncbi:hypothetical protein KUW19_07995 [Ferrimonas balearica]|uniref:hypothetical protein n=1 Tax=Ferrimonas balearica TaxID=44012 RepID=UPI001C94C894|nr:hypothetical protein [Ferrimonas balearica]MBY6106426.1 hypothetical protein [Ferrimonas balearica]